MYYFFVVYLGLYNMLVKVNDCLLVDCLLEVSDVEFMVWLVLVECEGDVVGFC